MSLPLQSVAPFIGNTQNRKPRLETGEYFIAINNTDDSLWIMDLSNMENDQGVYGRRGRLPPGIEGATGAVGYKGDVIVANRYDQDGEEVNDLWRINPQNPGDTTGVYGKQGDLPASLIDVESLDFHEGELYALAGDEAENLWRINIDNPSDETGDYGLVGTMAYRDAFRAAIASHKGKLLAVKSRGGADELWNVNPASPGSTSGAYGKVGDLPSGFYLPGGLTSFRNSLYVIDKPYARQPRLWSIDVDSPGDSRELRQWPETFRYVDAVCNLNFIEPAPPAPSPLPAGQYLFVVDTYDRELFVIDTADPDNTTFPYGRRGRIFPSNSNTRIRALVSYNGQLLAFDQRNRILNINVQNPGDGHPPYGYAEKALPGRVYSIAGATVHNSQILLSIEDGNDDSNRNSIWRANPDNWADDRSPYGFRGYLHYFRPNPPSGASPYLSSTGHGLGSHDGSLYSFGRWQNEHGIYRINPNDHDSISSPYGHKGRIEWGYRASATLDSDGTNLFVVAKYYNRDTFSLLRVDPSDPDSDTSPYGPLGDFDAELKSAYVCCFHTII